MGLLSGIFNRPPKLNVYDLIYIQMRQGTPWGNQPLTWNMKNCFDNHDFSKQWDRALKLELIQPAQTQDRLKYATLDVLKDAAKQYGLKTSVRKDELIQSLMDSGHGYEIAAELPKVVGLTDLGKDLLLKHDYIPYIIKRCKEIPCGHQKMFDKRERDNEASKYDVVLYALDEESFYGEGCYDDEDKQYARECRNYAKRDYRDFVKSVHEDAKHDS